MHKLGRALGLLIVVSGIVQLGVLGWYVATRETGQTMPALYLAAIASAAVMMVVVGGVMVRICTLNSRE